MVLAAAAAAAARGRAGPQLAGGQAIGAIQNRGGRRSNAELRAARGSLCTHQMRGGCGVGWEARGSRAPRARHRARARRAAAALNPTRKRSAPPADRCGPPPAPLASAPRGAGRGLGGAQGEEDRGGGDRDGREECACRRPGWDGGGGAAARGVYGPRGSPQHFDSLNAGWGVHWEERAAGAEGHAARLETHTGGGGWGGAGGAAAWPRGRAAACAAGRPRLSARAARAAPRARPRPPTLRGSRRARAPAARRARAARRPSWRRPTRRGRRCPQPRRGRR
jgi:hypothetical protein